MKRNRQRKQAYFSPGLKVILFIVIFSAIGVFWYHDAINNPVDADNEVGISFRVEKGESVNSIAKKLEEAELISSPLAFYWYTKSQELGEEIIAGRFVLNQTMNVPEILESLSNPQLAESVITIQEGLTIKDIEQKLTEMGLIERGELLQAVRNFEGWQYYSFLRPDELKSLELPLEGYLYPDTYFLDTESFEAHDLIYLALDNFERKWQSIDKSNSEISKKYSTAEIITMASIIETEVFGYEDRQMVAGILWKRLESGWTIGADATLLYITDDRNIDAKDLAIDSPYNTRKNLGLPPGPIANPSVESIKAALFPKESDYWFYLTTLDTGKVIYAKSNEEHNINRAKYLQ